MEEFIKNIILEKRYFELTSKEKSIIKDWAENEEEFDALKLTLTAVSNFKTENEEHLSPKIKQSLNERFTAKHLVHDESLWSKMSTFFFPRNTQFFKKPAFQLIMVALVVALVIPFLWQNKAPQYAMNEDREHIEVKEVQLEKTKGEKEGTFDVQIKEGTNDEFEKNNSAREMSQIQPNPINLEEARDNTPPILSSLENDVVSEEINLNEIVKTQSAKRSFTKNQQIDEVQADLQMEIHKDLDSNYKKSVPKQIDASETLGLLTALY